MRRLFRLWQTGAQDLRLLMAALRDPNRPTWLLPATLALAFFALDPLNFALPVLGVVDDFVLLPLLLRGLVSLAARSSRVGRDSRVVAEQ